jgi:hypothetical protein
MQDDCAIRTAFTGPIVDSLLNQRDEIGISIRAVYVIQQQTLLMKRINLTSQSDAISYLSSSSNYTTIYCADQTNWLLAKTLKACLAELPGFIRIHRQYAVNLRYITKVRLVAPKTAEVLIGNVWLPVSRRLFRDVDQKLGITQPNASRGRWHYMELLPDQPVRAERI